MLTLKEINFYKQLLSLPGSEEPICRLPLHLNWSLRIKTPVESGALISIFLQNCLSQHLVLWGFIRLPLIPFGFSTEIPSILMLKNQLLTAFLHHLALPNLSQDFLLIPKPLRAYLSGFWLMIDSIFISSLIAWLLNLPIRLPHQSQILSEFDFFESGVDFLLPCGWIPSAPYSIVPVLCKHKTSSQLSRFCNRASFDSGAAKFVFANSFCIARLFWTCLRTSS